MVIMFLCKQEKCRPGSMCICLSIVVNKCASGRTDRPVDRCGANEENTLSRSCNVFKFDHCKKKRMQCQTHVKQTAKVK